MDVSNGSGYTKNEFSSKSRFFSADVPFVHCLVSEEEALLPLHISAVIELFMNAEFSIRLLNSLPENDELRPSGCCVEF